jgi:molybdenum cofactor cytidylyltransferase
VMGTPADEGKRPIRFAAVILAAGRSTRMSGGPKLLRDLAGTTVIRRVAISAISAGLDPVVVVVGADSRAVRDALEGLEVRYATVSRAPGGRLVSLVTGVEALAGMTVAGAMVLLGDEPGLSEGHIRSVSEAADPDGSTVVRASFLDRPGHPVFLPRAVLREIPQLAAGQEPESSLWSLLMERGVPGATVAVAAPAPIDVDTQEDLTRAAMRESGD